MLDIGALIGGKYKILNVIHRSSTGIVYLALNERANKTWILKEIAKTLDVRTEQHLIADIPVLKSLNHPLIPNIVDVINTDDAYLIIMDYIAGIPLNQILSEHGAQSAENTIKWAIQLCDVLEYLHTYTNIDRLNLDPSNIFVQPTGNIALIDWYTKCIIDRQFSSYVVCYVGTNSYAAPEESFDMCDIRTDIYRLGAILHHMATGHKPEYYTSLPAPAATDPNISCALTQIIRKCTQLDPKNRYQSASSLKESLEHYCCNGPPSKASTMLNTLKFHWQHRKKLPSKSNMQRGPTKTSCLFPHKKECRKNPLQISQVQFSALAPKKLAKGEYSIIDILMFEKSYRQVIDKLIAESDTPLNETISGLFKVENQSEVKVVLSSPDIAIEDNEMTAFWNGEYLRFNFAILLPADYSKRQVLFTASIYINGLDATRLKFIAKCSSFWEQKLGVIRYDVLSAFISYASQDRQYVATLVQGMKKARPDMDIFFDIDSLRSGEDWQHALTAEIDRRDILYLCWSKYARESKWVEMEWRYALHHKGLECIEPIPIDPPDKCPPPEELKQKHFNDKMLYFIKANQYEEELKMQESIMVHMQEAVDQGQIF